MKVRITTDWSLEPFPLPSEKPSFTELRRPRPKSAVAFVYSLGVHAVAVWALGSMVQQVNARRVLIRHEYPWRALQMPLASVVWPTPLKDPVKGANPGPARRAEQASMRTGAPAAARLASSPALPAHEAADSGTPGTQDQARAREEKRFQLPVATPKKASQVLVRLDVPPEVKLQPNAVVPQVLLWQLPAPVKPKEELVAAAHREEPPVPERETPAVNPQLNARNREQALAELRHAAEPPVPVPALPLQVANTTPIRLLDGVAGTRLPNSTGPVVSAPEPVHVISVPELPVPQAHVVVLPVGNQGVPPPSATGSNTGGAGQGTAKATGQPGGAGENQRHGAGTAAGTEGVSKASQTSKPPGIPGGTGTGSDGSSKSGQTIAAGGGNIKSTALDPRAGSAAAGVAGTKNGGESAARGNGAGAPLPPGSTRIDRPRDGKYSVVVMGSSNLDAYPEIADLLKGKLVYTVYIRTGGRKEWILDYCLPKGGEQGVKLRGSAVPLDAPYPFTLYRPKLNLLNDPDYVIVHGFITAAGRFERLTALGDIDAASKEVLIGALDNWEFRPAARDGEPSAVEIALIIPREPI